MSKNKAEKFTAGQGENGKRLDAALAALYPNLGLRARRRLWAWRLVTLDGRAVGPGEQVHAGQLIEVLPLQSEEKDSLEPIPSSLMAELHAELRIVACGSEFCAVHKPAGLPSAQIGGGCRRSAEELVLANWASLLADWGRAQPGGSNIEPNGGPGLLTDLGRVCPDMPFPSSLPLLCNRLDTETSGLLLWACSAEALSRFRALEDAGAVKKLYYALVEGVAPAELLLQHALNTARRNKTLVLDALEADPARHTAARLVRVYGEDAASPRSLLEVMIQRGARHQIRAQLAAAGYPIVGDALYGKKSDAGRMYLHHFSISFEGFHAFSAPNWALD